METGHLSTRAVISGSGNRAQVAWQNDTMNSVPLFDVLDLCRLAVSSADNDLCVIKHYRRFYAHK